MIPLDPAAGFRDTLVAEICYALGASRRGLVHGLLSPLLRRPIGRLARIAASADAEIEAGGLSGAARRILPDLSMRPSVRGVERIPSEGPLLVVSNHPGGFDSVAILACLPRRDIKVVLSDAPLTRAFVAARRYFVFAPLTASGGAAALRACVRHLRSGGAVLVFANGDVEPDPELGREDALPFRDWSRSVEIMLREVSETRLQMVMASGVLLPKYLRNPLVRIRKTNVRRQKLAEVLQILHQVLKPGSVRLRPHLSFAEPVRAGDLDACVLLPSVIDLARDLLAEHRAALGRTSGPLDGGFRSL
ncbi:MAG: lysophospholipid acyltransferase family protein [Candidatus Aminicenantes bacterium]|nr:lysophospholipid acyltransferase family protein [Candidatus Aminicenantes bacterium]